MDSNSSSPSPNDPASDVPSQGDTGTRPPQSPDQTARPNANSGTGALAARPRRSPSKPSPRPLPKPSADDDDDDLDPFQGRRLRRSPPPGVLPRVAPEEPQLPPTPTQKGLSPSSAMSDSPTGIHNTPSKRARQIKSFPEPVHSSPLKQPPLRPENPESTPPADQDTTQNPSSQPAETQENEIPEQHQTHSARGVPAHDPLASKKALRDSLLADINQLRSDVRILASENERVRKFQETGKQAPRPSAADLTRLQDALRRDALSAPDARSRPSPADEWLETALNPMAFLPFGKADCLPPLLPAPADPRHSNASKDEETPISHHPIPMTGSEELPFLRVFTPLTLNSTMSLLPRGEGPDAGPLMQSHVITVASATPGLFSSTINMVVDTETLSITELSVPRLDPCAYSELSPFIKGMVNSSHTDALAQNVSVVTWAMSEWVRLATRRARFWCRAERELGTREGVAACVEKLKKGNKRRGRKGGRAPAPDAVQTENSEEDDLGLDRKGGGRLSRADLLPHLGRTGLDLDLDVSAHDDDDEERLGALVRIQWRIEFDWTGEGQDKISLLVDAPPKWHGKDNRGSLAGVPAMFDKLVASCEDPLDAVKAVVALLVGDMQ